MQILRAKSPKGARAIFSRTTSKSIAPFTLQSITSSGFRWLHSEAWGEQHFNFFIKQRQLFTENWPHDGLCGPRTKSCKIAKPQRWILHSLADEDALLGWVEMVVLQGPGTYVRALILCSLEENNDFKQLQSQGLLHLVTAIFIAADLDICQIEAYDESTLSLIKQSYSWFWNQPVLARHRDPLKRKRLDCSLPQCLIAQHDRQQWFEIECVQVEKAALGYLEKRVARQNRPTLKQSLNCRPKRNVFSILFGQGRKRT